MYNSANLIANSPSQKEIYMYTMSQQHKLHEIDKRVDTSKENRTYLNIKVVKF